MITPFRAILSPCTGVCCLDEQGLCEGCYRTGNEIAPAFLIMAAAAIAFFAILRFRETYRSPFAGGTSNVAEPGTARSASTPAA